MFRQPGFYGSTLRSRSLGDFTMTERAYPAGFATPPHVHMRPLFCVVLGGSYQEINGGRTHDCTASTILFHAPQEEHLERFGDSGGRSLIVEIEPAWYERVREIAPAGVRTTARDGGAVRMTGARLYREFCAGDDESRLIIEGLLLQITGEFLRVRETAENGPPRWLGDVREYINANFSRRITLGAIGKAANVHPVHAAQTFRRYHNCTIGEYLRRLRIEFACRELANTQSTVAEIAANAGFSDQSHFHRTFKSLMGVAPSRYRTETAVRRPVRTS